MRNIFNCTLYLIKPLCVTKAASPPSKASDSRDPWHLWWEVSAVVRTPWQYGEHRGLDQDKLQGWLGIFGEVMSPIADSEEQRIRTRWSQGILWIKVSRLEYFNSLRDSSPGQRTVGWEEQREGFPAMGQDPPNQEKSLDGGYQVSVSHFI